MPQAEFIDAVVLKRTLNLRELKIIDIREPDEFARERIENSENLPLSTIGGSNLQRFKNQKVLVLCKSGVRTRQALKYLEKIEGKVWCLAGGLDQWKNAALPTITDESAPLEIMRQVQIIAGSMVLIGTLGGLLVSPYFTVLSLIAGSGLLLAGTTGFCGLAKLLLLLPYNKRNQGGTRPRPGH